MTTPIVEKPPVGIGWLGWTKRRVRDWAPAVVVFLLGIAFFLVVLGAERVVVHRAPEHVA